MASTKTQFEVIRFICLLPGGKSLSFSQIRYFTWPVLSMVWFRWPLFAEVSWKLKLSKTLDLFRVISSRIIRNNLPTVTVLFSLRNLQSGAVTRMKKAAHVIGQSTYEMLQSIGKPSWRSSVQKHYWTQWIKDELTSKNKWNKVLLNSNEKRPVRLCAFL